MLLNAAFIRRCIIRARIVERIFLRSMRSFSGAVGATADIMIVLNSCTSISPSPSASTIWMMPSSSSGETLSPYFLKHSLSSPISTVPPPSSSIALNASSNSFSCVSLRGPTKIAISVRNSSKFISSSSPSLTSPIIALICSSGASMPIIFIACCSSLAFSFPELSSSTMSKKSRYSSTSSALRLARSFSRPFCMSAPFISARLIRRSPPPALPPRLCTICSICSSKASSISSEAYSSSSSVSVSE